MYGFTLEQIRAMPVWLLGVYAASDEDVTTDEGEGFSDDALARIAAGQPL